MPDAGYGDDDEDEDICACFNVASSIQIERTATRKTITTVGDDDGY